VTAVVVTRQAEKDLKSVPAHVAQKFAVWRELVEAEGLQVARKVPGYHDEPLHGALLGQRSIRLNAAYRAYYRVVDEQIELVHVLAVDKHLYRGGK
jgi:proteic killer suppression protein